MALAVIDSVMPAGVEHLFARGSATRTKFVIDSVMPAGVEHDTQPTRYVSGVAVSVIDSVMPAGVEHPSSVATLASSPT